MVGEVSAVDASEVLVKEGERPESSYDRVDDADEFVTMSCRSVALYARTFVVEINSVGREIWLRSIGLMPYRWLLVLDSIAGVMSS